MVGLAYPVELSSNVFVGTASFGKHLVRALVQGISPPPEGGGNFVEEASAILRPSKELPIASSLPPYKII